MNNSPLPNAIFKYPDYMNPANPKVLAEKVNQYPAPLTPKAKPAHTFLEESVSVMKQRAALRDAPGGERSMEKTVAIFNAWTGSSMSIEDGWRFMIALKQAREVQGKFNADDYIDGAAYFALLGEDESGKARNV